MTQHNNAVHKSNLIIHYISYLVALIIFFYPTSAFILPHGTSTPNVILGIFGVFSLFLIKSKRQLGKIEKQIIYVVLAFFLVSAISYIVQDWNYLGFKKIGRHAKLLIFIPIVFLFARVNIFQGSLWYGVCLGSIVAGIYAIYQGAVAGWPENFRAEGAIFCIYYGNFAMTLAFISLAGVDYFKNRPFKKLQLLLPCLSFILALSASFLSGTRGAWLAFPALLIIAGWYYHKKISYKQLVAVILCLVTLVIVLLYIPQINTKERILSVKEEIKDYVQSDNVQGSIGRRLEMWKASWKIFKNNPVLGAGLGGYKQQINKMIEEGRISDIVSHYDHPHNSYLLILSSRGLLGFITLLLVFILPLMYCVKVAGSGLKNSHLGLLGVFLVIGYMHFALTESVLDRSHPINYYVFFLSVCISSIVSSSREEHNTN